MARANGRQSSRAFCLDLGIRLTQINNGDTGEVGKLAELLGYEAEAVLPRSVRLLENNWFDISGARFHGKSLKRRRLRLCPACLADDERDPSRIPGTRRYLRMSWLLAAVRTCGTHACELAEVVDEAPPYIRHDFCQLLDYYASEVSTLSSAIVARQQTSFERFISERLEGHSGHGDLLDTLPLSVCIELCEMFGAALAFGKKIKTSGLSDDQLVKASDTAFDHLKAGEQGLRAALDRISLDTAVDAANGGGALYGRLYEALLQGYPGSDYGRVRGLIREHTVATKALLPGASVFGPVDNARFVSSRAIATECGLGLKMVRGELTRLGYFKDQRNNRAEFIPAEAAKRITQFLRDTVTRKQAMLVLGCNQALLRGMVSEGLIRPRYLVEAIDGVNEEGLARYSSAELRDLKLRLEKAAGATLCPEGIPLREAATRTGLAQADLIRMVADGGVTAVLLGSRPLADSILVSPESIAAIVNSDRLGLTKEDAADVLGLRPRHMAKLARLAGLKVYRVRTATHLPATARYRAADIHDFDSRYVSLPRLARETGVHPAVLKSRASEAGIRSAFAPEKLGHVIIPRSQAGALLKSGEIDTVQSGIVASRSASNGGLCRGTIASIGQGKD